MNAPTTTRPPGPDPLAIPGVIRIPLEHHQAAMLAGLGEVFVVVSRSSYPNQPGLGLLVLPVSHKTAVDACNVALGTHAARRFKDQPRASVAAP